MKEVEIVKAHITGIKNSMVRISGYYNKKVDLELYFDDEINDFSIKESEQNNTFILKAHVPTTVKKIHLVDKRNNKKIVTLNNNVYKRIFQKVKGMFLDILTDVIYEQNDFIGINYVKISGVKNPVLEITGSIIKENYVFYLIVNGEKILLKNLAEGKNFLLRYPIHKKVKKIELIVNVDKKDYYVANIKNRISKRTLRKINNVFKFYSYRLYENKNIEFAQILMTGVLHPQLTISGVLKNENDKISMFYKGKKVEFFSKSSPNKKEFYHYTKLKNRYKKIDICLNNEKVLEVYNYVTIRIVHKVKNIFKKIYHILYVFYRGIRAAWKQYHFIIPPKLWKKYWIELKNKLRNQDNGYFYRPMNITEYNKWLEIFEKKEPYKKQKYNPLISILIPVYNIDGSYLTECIESILNQTYQNFEICLVDDASTKEETISTLKYYQDKDSRIKVKFNKKNGHISKTTNEALKMASGEFVGLVDNDDLLTQDALYEVVKLLNKKKEADLIYSDEDKINFDGERCYPNFKPDYSPDTLMSLNYICHFTVIRKKIIEQVGGFEIGLEGAQDHDLFLKISEVTKNIYHIPKILYHWRMIEGSTSATLENKSYANDKGKIAIEHALIRRGLSGEVNKDRSGYYIVNYKLKKEPLISIIIPTRDYSDILDKCLVSIYKKTTYSNYEIIVVNNNSSEDATFKLFEKYKKEKNNFKVIDANFEFNYSKINNIAVKKAKGDYIVLLNNDTEIITPEWLEKMVGYASLEHIGAVGAKLLYPDTTVQHGGVILGLGGVASHAYIGSSREDNGMYGRLRVPYNYSAVTAACLMIKKSKYVEIGGLEEKLKVAYNDMDLNIKLLEKGYYNIFLPQVELFHHESKSRGFDTTTEKYKRFLKESDFMNQKWSHVINNDKFYNINFSKKGWFMLDKHKER